MNKKVKDFFIPEQHLCTRGHFPGHPIVPGAYLTALIEQLVLADAPAMRMASLRKVKFLKPLAPGLKAQLEYQLSGAGKVQFSISVGPDRILEGSALLEPR